MFAHADIDDIRIAVSNRDSADRTGLEKSIRNIPPTDAHVIGFPKTAASRAHVISFRIADDSGSAVRAPTAKRPNRSPLERFEYGVVIISGRRRFCLRGQMADQEA